MNTLKEIIQNKIILKTAQNRLLKWKIYKNGEIPDDINNVINAVFITISIKLKEIFRC
jgi:hypothetical protein